MQRVNRASIAFTAKWKSHHGTHSDRCFINKVDFWRDIFPGKLGKNLASLKVGEKYCEHFEPGELVAPFSQDGIKKFNDDQFERSGDTSGTIPVRGRFYPQGYGWRALQCFPQNPAPMRILKHEDGTIIADTNHPLSRYSVSVEAQICDKWCSSEERGGSCNDIAEIITSRGPGMQVPFQGVEPDFYSAYPFRRVNDRDDRLFYKTPRMVNHIDDVAIEQITSIYSALLSPNTKILDLMSSWVSHIPPDLKNYEAVGLGLNQEELSANRQLSETILHDLNQSPSLPLPNNEFDAVICTVSIEYLTKPLEVLAEIARVTKPGGLFVTTFSDRWFPGKEIELWSEMHEFERLGLIMDYFLRSKAFEDIHTESILGLMRPPTDKYIGSRPTSDPVFAVWGYVRNTSHQ